MSKIKGRDITGLRFGTLVVVELEPELTKHKQKKWKCVCDCGSVTSILQHSLTTGNTTKCSDHPKNEYVIKGDYAELDVSTEKYPSTHTKVDTEDLQMLLNHKSAKNSKMRWMVYNSSYGRWGSYVSATDRKTLIHRLIMGVTDANYIVDHINGDTLDNRKSNLRVITRAENNKNMRKHSDNTSGYTGVGLKDGLWVASIRMGYKKYYIGGYNSKEHANIAYRAAAKVLGFSERHGL